MIRRLRFHTPSGLLDVDAMQRPAMRSRPLLQLSIDDVIGACCTRSGPVMARVGRRQLEPSESAMEGRAVVVLRCT